MKFHLVNQSTQTISQTKDGEAKVIYFGIEDFKSIIVNSDACFMCGELRHTKVFDDEHVIPDWVLRRYDIQNHRITLPNGAFVRYAQYKVPCCRACNNQLGITIENPISKLLTLSYPEICALLKDDVEIRHKLFRWMCLMYVKTHLKDRSYDISVDRRKDDGKIGDYYDWAEMHHVHCMARAHISEATIDSAVYGSLVILPSLIIPSQESFDYIDNLGAQTAMVQIGGILVYAVFNDSGCAGQMCLPLIENISGPVSPFQNKEIFAHLSYISQNLEAKPRYNSNLIEGKYFIKADFPEGSPRLLQPEVVSLGSILHHYINLLLSHEVENRAQILDEVKAGRRGYLFDEAGNFIQHIAPSM